MENKPDRSRLKSFIEQARRIRDLLTGEKARQERLTQLQIQEYIDLNYPEGHPNDPARRRAEPEQPMKAAVIDLDARRSGQELDEALRRRAALKPRDRSRGKDKGGGRER